MPHPSRDSLPSSWFGHMNHVTWYIDIIKSPQGIPLGSLHHGWCICYHKNPTYRTNLLIRTVPGNHGLDFEDENDSRYNLYRTNRTVRSWLDLSRSYRLAEAIRRGVATWVFHLYNQRAVSLVSWNVEIRVVLLFRFCILCLWTFSFLLVSEVLASFSFRVSSNWKNTHRNSDHLNPWIEKWFIKNES